MIERRGRPAPYRGVRLELVRYLGWAYLLITGWKLRGDWPAMPRAVLVAAPHTSNWDGINMLAAAAYFRVSVQWMGKESLTRGPFGWLVRALGCVPIDRAQRHDMVRAMVAQFAARPALLLLVPPEGTRSRRVEWKSGFYHIAYQAQVPIILTIMDYGTHTIRVAGPVDASGDYERDLPVIRGAII